MRVGRKILQDLYANTPRETDSVHYGGITIKRLILRKGAKYYKLAIDRYLIDKVLCKIETLLQKGDDWQEILPHLKPDSKYTQPEKWIDLAGLLALDEKVKQLITKVTEGEIDSVEELNKSLNNIYDDYYADEWSYVYSAFQQEFGTTPDQLGTEKILELVERWREAASSLNALTIADAKIEFADFSQIGFGLYGDKEQKNADFKAVRGSLETNAVIKKCEKEAVRIKERVENLKNYLKK
jgi:hypothetical protein